MRLWIQISPGSGEPIYVQIVEQISEAIARRELATGNRLPAVRKLASELVINPNTVARAYMVLEQSGLVTTKIGSGTFVADPKLRSSTDVDINMLTERIDALITRGLNLGIDAGDLTAMFKTRLDKFVRKPKNGEKK